MALRVRSARRQGFFFFRLVVAITPGTDAIAPFTMNRSPS
jgi:hypothetical protein